ncbi:hypothetical protein C5167_038581 [Papaver somniferum]|uniref:Uncharacterized protein n=1 Tax=Papaver somniferum TaxID=3469 RepID=A0A4Y7ID16_PAPSO|nr:uncharacterized protein LOC113332123 [Papaver somniferum]RZC45642.1 hypothetical protein C5167_038581 [Papaver somniferum]
MACLDMYNNTEQQQQHQNSYCSSQMSPRISFSLDFVDTQRMNNTTQRRDYYQSPPASSDFEFSITDNYTMMAAPADELFSKGKLLPFKDTSNNNTKKITLRDELLNDQSTGSTPSSSSSRPPKSPIRWKELLGLKRNRNNNNVSSKKPSSKMGNEEVQANKTQQEMVHSDGGFSFQDSEA